MAFFERVNFSNSFSVNIYLENGVVLSRIGSGTLRTLCEPKDVGNSCDFSKNSPNPRFGTTHIGLYIT